MSLKKGILLGVALLLIIIISFRIVVSIQKSNTKPIAAVKLIPVKVEPVAARLIQDNVNLTGNIVPEKVVNVASTVSGRVLTIRVNEGDSVGAGQVLAIIETTELEHSLRNAEQNLILANSTFNNAKLNLNRRTKLYHDGVISQQDLEEAELQYTSAETAKRQAETNLSLIKVQLESQGWSTGKKAPNGSLNASRLIAPISGVVLKKYVEEGTLVGPSASTPLVSLGKIDRVKIQVNAEEKLLPFLHSGQPVSITVDAWPDPFAGRIAKILPQVDPVTRTISFEIFVANGNRRLLPGMFAKVSLARQAVDKTPSIPLKALLEDESGSYVYVLNKGKALQRRVTTGLSDEQYVQILSGLVIGESVVIAGQHSVDNGSRVEVVGRAN